MLLSDETIRASNRAFFAMILKHAREDYEPEGTAWGWQDHSDIGGWLQGSASLGLWKAFEVLVAGDMSLGLNIAALAEERAERALATGDFQRMFWPLDPALREEIDSGRVTDIAYGITPRQRHIQEVCGRTECLKVLAYAAWFRTGSRSMAKWQRALECQRERYEIYGRRPFYTGSCEEMMMAYLEADQPEEAIAIYRRDFRKALAGPPANKQFVLSSLHVLYVVAEFARGNKEMEPFMRRGVERWYVLARLWEITLIQKTTLPAVPDWMALGWAWLRGKYVTGVTDLPALLEDLRYC